MYRLIQLYRRVFYILRYTARVKYMYVVIQMYRIQQYNYPGNNVRTQNIVVYYIQMYGSQVLI